MNHIDQPASASPAVPGALEKLLAFSNAVASEKDRYKLSKIINQQLKELFNIKEYLLWILSEDKQKRFPFLFDKDACFAQHPAFQRVPGNWFDNNDGVYDVIIASPGIVYFDWSKRPEPHPFDDVIKDMELKQMGGSLVKLGKEDIGVMSFSHDNIIEMKGLESLYLGICSQLAIVVSNFLALEKVNEQLAEIRKYKQQLEEEKVYLQEEIATTGNFSDIIGGSTEMKKVFRLVNQVAFSESTVLLLGETGTGKEMVARAIHHGSSRKHKLMVKVNCAALPMHLVESELFGHERGSFTGAFERRIGKFELANGGTLFLDEVGELPPEIQGKLLRVLQENEIERIGGKATIKVNTRIIAATNRDLEKEMEEGRFRKDLYYRLHIFPICLPPLRTRREDIPLLASYFLKRFSKATGKRIETISNQVLADMQAYHWPGNVRELEHFIERAVLLETGSAIRQIHLPVPRGLLLPQQPQAVPLKTIDENEREHIFHILRYCQGRIGGPGGAAEILGVPTSTLHSKMKRLGIKRTYTSL